MEETVKQLTIDTGWQLRARTAGATEAQFTATDGWTPANVPGVVQQDLLAAGRIPDPFVGLNEHEVQWVGERDWLYRCRFDLPEEIAGEDHVDLCFDGLDTIATVWLNGEEILRSDNQFVPHRVPVKALLRPTGNELRLRFDSALLAGQALQAHYGPRDAWNGDPSRVYVRKAGYNYGWDWGPVIMTAGPWRPIHLEAYGARIASLHAPAEVAPDLRSAAIPVAVRIATGTLTAGFAVALALRDPSGNVVAEARVRAEVATVNHLFTLTDPQLWWPRGHGAQPLYILTATLMRDDIELDRQETRLGLRRLRLVHEAVRGEAGQSFLFEVNNAPIFGGGYNWIPADSLPTRVTPERYRAWLELAAEGHTAMLRVWGGGYYEDDVFYDLCDELGILVWQDFMFACGMYPAHPAFLASVRQEAEAALRRLRHHPSLVLWCGNNEDYQIAGVRYDPAVTTDLADSAFPARATAACAATTRRSATATSGGSGTARCSPIRTTRRSSRASSASSAWPPPWGARRSTSSWPLTSSTRRAVPSIATSRRRAGVAASPPTWWRTSATRTTWTATSSGRGSSRRRRWPPGCAAGDAGGAGRATTPAPARSSGSSTTAGR